MDQRNSQVSKHSGQRPTLPQILSTTSSATPNSFDDPPRDLDHDRVDASRLIPMSEFGESSSDLSEIEDGAAFKSDLGSNQSEHDDQSDQEAESAPETEAETERLEISPQKPNAANGVTDANNPPESSPLRRPEESTGTPQPGLTAQDILGDATPAGGKRKRPASVSAHAGDPVNSPPKRRTNSMRMDRKLLSKSAEGSPATDHAVAGETSAEDDDATDPGNAADTSPQNTPRPQEEEEEEDEEKHPLNDPVEEDDEDDEDDDEMGEDEDEEAGEGEDEEMPDAETDAAAKTEDELAKKKAAMDALVPIEKLFAVFRDKLFDERWAELTAELDLLNDPNTTHADYIAMRQAIDARRDEKVQVEEVLLQHQIAALETRIIAQKAQIQAQYFQTVRQVREQYIDQLNQQFSQIQRERRHFKTKEPYYSYQFDPNRARLVAQQNAYNTEVSVLSGIARNLGFPAAPEMRPATQQDVENDMRQMKIPVKPQTKPLSSQMGRAEEAAAEEQFLERTPWANPQHPAHQQARMNNRHYLDGTRPLSTTPANRLADHQRLPAGSGSTIGLASDPPSGLTYSDALPNGTPPYEQLNRREDDVDDPSQHADPASNHNNLPVDNDPRPKPIFTSAALDTENTAAHSSNNVPAASNPSHNLVPTDRASPEPDSRRPYHATRESQSPTPASRDNNFSPGHENLSNTLGVSRPFGVR